MINKILKNVQKMANIKYTAQCIKFIITVPANSLGFMNVIL